MGQSGDATTQKAIRQMHHLDESTLTRCMIQLNDLSPVGIYSEDSTSAFYYHSENFKATKVLSIHQKALYLKPIYLGRSYQNQELVTTLLWARFKVTLILAVISMIFATFIGVMLGILSSMYRDTWVDRSILIFSSLGVSAPSFFVAILLALFFGYYWSDLTGLNFKGSLYDYDDIGHRYLSIKNLILPILALAWRPIAIISQLTRNSMLEVLNEDYIRTAFAKGLSRTNVFWKHALINALNPVVTSISSWFGSLLAGAYFVELIFDIKGLGALTVNALMKFDVPVIFGAALSIAMMFILISFLVDYLYRVIDPRVATNNE